MSLAVSVKDAGWVNWILCRVVLVARDAVCVHCCYWQGGNVPFCRLCWCVNQELIGGVSLSSMLTWRQPLSLPHGGFFFFLSQFLASYLTPLVERFHCSGGNRITACRSRQTSAMNSSNVAELCFLFARRRASATSCSSLTSSSCCPPARAWAASYSRWAMHLLQLEFLRTAPTCLDTQ